MSKSKKTYLTVGDLMVMGRASIAFKIRMRKLLNNGVARRDAAWSPTPGVMSNAAAAAHDRRALLNLIRKCFPDVG